MSNSVVNIETYEKLQTAAHIKMEDVIPSLSQLMGYRQVIAQQLLQKENGGTEEELRGLKDSWLYVNETINRLLGL